MIMRKVIIFLGLFLIFCVSHAQVGTNDSLNRGVARTGITNNGCDCEDGQEFTTRRGNDTLLVPRVMRTGKLLKVTAKVEDDIPGCGTTDEEVLVDVDVKWTGNYLSRIIQIGVEYQNITGVEDGNFQTNSGGDFDKIPYNPEICPEDTVKEGENAYSKVWHDSYSVSVCGDTSMRLMMQLLCPGSRYRIRPYVITVDGFKVLGSDSIFTKERNKCGGWIANKKTDGGNEITNGENDTIILVYDHEGNPYGVVQIGSQCWTRENMRCDNSPNQRIITPQITGVDPERGNIYERDAYTPFFYRYDALLLSFRQRGNLYNWPAVVDTFGLVTELPPGVRRGICPEGWHVPNDYEWYELIKYELDVDPNHPIAPLDSIHNWNPEWNGDSVVKLTFGCDWTVDTSDAFPGGYMQNPEKRNYSGFSALPANNLQENGTLGYHKDVANFWLGIPFPTDPKKAYSWHIDHDRKGVSSYPRTRVRGFSVRCLRDQLTIAVNPNTNKFCKDSKVTYTSKVAQETMSNFTFTWDVYKDRIPISQNCGTGNTLVYQHNSPGKYKIICSATRNAISFNPPKTGDSLPSMALQDSVFVEVGEESCHIITLNSPSPCVGETVTVFAQVPGEKLTGNYNLSWKINDKDTDDPTLSSLHITSETDTSFTCTFPKLTKDSTYKITVELTPTGGGVCTLDICKDTVRQLVSILPSITVCPDCDADGFVIKNTSNLASANTVLRDRYGNAVTYNHKKFNTWDTIKISTNNSPYSFEMESSSGCRDTVRNLVLKVPKSGCEVQTISDNEHDAENSTPTRPIIASVDDHEGNNYSVVQIGNQCWMRENMRATTSPTLSLRKESDPSVDNNIVMNRVDSASVRSFTAQAAHWYLNNRSIFERFGLLYNWCAAADTFYNREAPVANPSSSSPGEPWACQLPANWRGICPEGWHLPTENEWRAMEMEINGGVTVPTTDTLAGMLAGGCDWTRNTNNNAPGNYHDLQWDSIGFKAVPAGHFNNDTMYNKGSRARFWTATEGSDISQAYQRMLIYNKANVDRNTYSKDYGMSVRCIRNLPQIVIHQKANDTCTYTVYATADGISGIQSYTWTINGRSVTTTKSDTTFALNANESSYHIVCVATGTGTDNYSDSIDIVLQHWPPTITVCSDNYAYPVKVTCKDVASTIWVNNDPEKNDTIETPSPANSYYIERESGDYPVWLIHSSGACLPGTVQVGPFSTTQCSVLYPNTGNGGNEHSPANATIDSVLDANGNRYPVVQIGNQCWVRENMRTTNGLTSGNILNNACTSSVTLDNTSPYYYNYCDADTMPLELRGYLYNQYAANLICPTGWHLPSKQEWIDMNKVIMGNTNKTCMMAGGCDWKKHSGSNTAGNDQAIDRNASGFTLIPAGNLESDGSFANLKQSARLWTSTVVDDKTCRVSFAYNSNSVDYKNLEQVFAGAVAYSVRCVRDIPYIAIQENVETDDSCRYKVSATPIDIKEDLNYQWTINGTQYPTTNSYVTFTYSEANHYRIVCQATGVVTNAVFKDTLDIVLNNWPPTITTCIDSFAGAVKINSLTNVDRVVWCVSSNDSHDGDTVGIATAANSRIENLKSGNYVCRMYQDASNSFCRPDTIAVNVIHTTCTVLSSTDNERTYATNSTSAIIDSVWDHQGNRYAVVEIGGRCWMRENMRATTTPNHPNDNIVTDNLTSEYNSRKAYWYNNDPGNDSRYGLLYNWCAAADSTNSVNNNNSPWSCTLDPNERGICPEGWHLPTHQEWQEMEDAVNGSVASNTGNNYYGNYAALLVGGCDWQSSNTGSHPGGYSASNNWGASNFAAMPAGQFNGSSMADSSYKALFWTATEGSTNSQAYQRTIEYNKAGVLRTALDKSQGLSVRCVRNTPIMALGSTNSSNCIYTITATIDQNIPNITYNWMVQIGNGNPSPQSSVTNEMVSTYTDATDYYIECIAKVGDIEICRASKAIHLTNWPPTMTYYVDTATKAVRILSRNSVVSNATWTNSQGTTVSNDTAIGKVLRDVDVRYIWLYNSANNCRADTIVINDLITRCNVTSLNATEVSTLSNSIDSVRDAQGNDYAVVEIAGRCWMRENMRTTKNNSLNDLTYSNNSNNCTKGTANNNQARYYDYCSSDIPFRQRGYLYNANAAGQICPPGWELPSLQEWKDMYAAAMGTTNNNMSYKMAGGCDWRPSSGNKHAGNYSYDVSHRNSSHFTLIPAGNMDESGNLGYIYESANFWTSTPVSNNSNEQYRQFFDYNQYYAATGSLNKPKKRGFSVRCIRSVPTN